MPAWFYRQNNMRCYAKHLLDWQTEPVEVQLVLNSGIFDTPHIDNLMFSVTSVNILIKKSKCRFLPTHFSCRWPAQMPRHHLK